MEIIILITKIPMMMVMMGLMMTTNIWVGIQHVSWGASRKKACSFFSEVKNLLTLLISIHLLEKYECAVWAKVGCSRRCV